MEFSEATSSKMRLAGAVLLNRRVFQRYLPTADTGIPPENLALALLCWHLKIRIYQLSDKSFYLDNGGDGGRVDSLTGPPELTLIMKRSNSAFYYGLDKIAVGMRFFEERRPLYFATRPAARGGRSARLDITFTPSGMLLLTNAR